MWQEHLKAKHILLLHIHFKSGLLPLWYNYVFETPHSTDILNNKNHILNRVVKQTKIYLYDPYLDIYDLKATLNLKMLLAATLVLYFASGLDVAAGK